MKQKFEAPIHMKGRSIRKVARLGETRARVFIVESLSDRDEKLGRYDGRVLAEVLKICRKPPEYKYVRTKVELRSAFEDFARSDCRYLHLSCHADEVGIATTQDDLSYEELAELLGSSLSRRRLFVSACCAGTQEFAEMLDHRNIQMHSVVAPVGSVPFSVSVAFWGAFYVRLFNIDRKKMSNGEIRTAIQPLCDYFNEPFLFSRRRQSGKWKHEVISPQSDPVAL